MSTLEYICENAREHSKALLYDAGQTQRTIRWRRARSEYMSAYCKEWRARKKRQAAMVEDYWKQIDHIEYLRRCAEISREARCR